MKKYIQVASLLIMISIPSLVWSGDISKESLDRIMALSGLNKQVAEFPGMVGAGVEQARQQGSAIPDAEFSEMQRAIESAFQASEILSAISREVKISTSEAGAKELLAWYESDLGRKITIAEEKATTPAAYQEMIREAQSLLADEERVKYAKKLDSLLSSTDMAMQLQETTGLAVFTAMSTAMNPDQPVNVEAFKAQMSAQAQQLRANIEQLVIVSYVYSYKHIDTESIEKYVKFLEQPNTKRFNYSVIKGTKYALDQSIRKMANSMAAIFKKHAEKGNRVKPGI